MIIMLFFAIASTGSAECIAVSSLVVYDIYRKYFNPNATNDDIMKWSRVVTTVFGIGICISRQAWATGRARADHIANVFHTADLPAPEGPRTITESLTSRISLYWITLRTKLSSLCRPAFLHTASHVFLRSSLS